MKLHSEQSQKWKHLMTSPSCWWVQLESSSRTRSLEYCKRRWREDDMGTKWMKTGRRARGSPSHWLSLEFNACLIGFLRKVSSYQSVSVTRVAPRHLNLNLTTLLPFQSFFAFALNRKMPRIHSITQAVLWLTCLRWSAVTWHFDGSLIPRRSLRRRQSQSRWWSLVCWLDASLTRCKSISSFCW